MARLIEGVKVCGQIADLGVQYGLGIRPGIWQLDDSEAEVFARILARRADKGNAQAVEQLENLVEYADYIRAATIGIDKTIQTVKEVKEHGVDPFFLGLNKRKQADSAGDGNRQPGAEGD